MSVQRISLQPAYILHQRPYRDSSALLEVFTPEFGRVGLVARGVRGKKARWSGLLQMFQPLLISWSSRGDLGTLTGVESQGPAMALAPAHIASGFYLNEVLMRLLTRHDAHEELFSHYDATLRGMALIGSSENPNQLEVLLRQFELQMLSSLGYGLVLDHDIDTGTPIEAARSYRYVVDRGPVRDSGEQDPDDVMGVSIHGRTLQELQAGILSDDQSRIEAKQLLRVIINHHLGHKPLNSRLLLQTPKHGRDTLQQNPSASPSVEKI